MAHGIEAQDVEDDTDQSKLARIREICGARQEHEIWVVRYGMTNAEYTAVEAAVIDVLASFPISLAPWGSSRRPLEPRDELTNRRREDAAGKGTTLLGRLVDELGAPESVTTEPLLLITLNPWEDRDEIVAGGRADGAATSGASGPTRD